MSERLVMCSGKRSFGLGGGQGDAAWLVTGQGGWAKIRALACRRAWPLSTCVGAAVWGPEGAQFYPAGCPGRWAPVGGGGPLSGTMGLRPIRQSC